MIALRLQKAKGRKTEKKNYVVRMFSNEPMKGVAVEVPWKFVVGSVQPAAFVLPGMALESDPRPIARRMFPIGLF